MRARHWLGMLGGLAVCVRLATAQTPSLTLLGLPPGRVESYGTAISADGQVLTGFTVNPTIDNTYRGFSWTASTGLDEWGSRSSVPANTQPTCITADGSAVFGMRQPAPTTSPNDLEAFRYSNGTYQSLGSLPRYNRVATYGASGDGQVAVGLIASTGLSISGGMRWTPSGGIEHIALPHPNDAGGWFTGISRDGITAIGTSASSVTGNFEGYTWTQAAGWRPLPVPSGIHGAYDCSPNGVNGDGSLVVGTITPAADDTKAVLWRNGVPTDLGTVGEYWSMGANAVSDNGRVVAGFARDTLVDRRYAMVWLDGSGPINLQDYLATLGVNVPAGVRLAFCQSISADGRTIVGSASVNGSYQAFVATIPSPATIAVTLAAISGVTVARRRSTSSV